jgi:hypothetical protein
LILAVFCGGLATRLLQIYGLPDNYLALLLWCALSVIFYMMFTKD